VVKVVRRQLVHDDETGGDVAVLGVAEVEFLTDQDLLQRLLTEHRDQRMGSGQLPFDEPPASDADKARELERRIAAWADANGVDARAEWVYYFGPGDEAPVGPLGAGLPFLMEFVGERNVPALGLDAVLDEEREDPDPDDDGGDVDPEDYDDEIAGPRRDVVDADLPDQDHLADDDDTDERDDDAGHGDAKVMQFSGR
jgi:hypothetical protein